MKFGLIARADSRGLGVQTKAFHDNLHPAKTLVVDCPSAKPLPIRRDWYPDATWVSGIPTAQDFRKWLQGLDVVYTAETAYNRVFWDESERAGVKTVLHSNYEFLDRRDRPTLWAMPSMWHYDDVPFRNKTFLPVPIETDRFHVSDPQSETATNFLHVVGRPAIHDRNGTEILLRALEHIKSRVTVTIKCQEGGYVSSLAPGLQTNTNVTFVIEPGDVDNYWDLYRGQDVLVMPRRFGGLSLPVNEALGAGMPVVMPDISPNNTWLPQEWLVPAGWQSAFMAKQKVDVYGVNPKDLAAMIDRFATDQDFYAKAKAEAARLRTEFSWDNLLPAYQKLLEGM